MNSIYDKNYYAYCFLMFILLCLSGNPLFSYYSTITALFFGFITFVLIICKHNVLLNVLGYVSLFIIIFVFQSILILDFSITSTGYVIMKFIIGSAVAIIIGKQFVNCYVDVMWFLSIVSLLGYFLTITLGLLPGIPCAEEGISQILYTQLFSFELLARNSGMFWEPGAFAGYLSIAIFFAITTNQVSKKYLIPFLLALITTYSTTGYLSLFTIMLYFLWRNNKLSSVQRFFFICVLLIGIYYVYNSLDFLGEKIHSTDGISNSRITNYATYSQQIASNFLFGSSFTIHTISSGNGFLSFLVDIGILGVLYYFIRLYKSCRRAYSTFDSFFFVLMIVIVLQGECFLNYPLFMGLPCVLYQRSIKNKI